MEAGKLNLPAPIAFLRDRYGGDFDTSDGVVAATPASSRLVGGDPEAVALIIFNLGSDTVFVRPKGPASPTNGIALVAGSGSVAMSVKDDGPLPTYDWNVYGNSGSQNVYWLRLSRYNTTDKA